VNSANQNTLACRTCHERIGYRRGVCDRCLCRHRQAVRDGLTTWQALVQAGLVLPPQRRGERWRRLRN
jgi:hypothetical protein